MWHPCSSWALSLSRGDGLFCLKQSKRASTSVRQAAAACSGLAAYQSLCRQVTADLKALGSLNCYDAVFEGRGHIGAQRYSYSVQKVLQAATNK